MSAGARRRAAALVAGAALAGGCCVAAVALLHTQVPAGLRTSGVDVARVFGRHAVARADAYSRFSRIDELLARVAVLVVLAVYAARGARLARESAAGRIGTGFLLGMLGLALVWIAQAPFGLAQVWWDRRHGLSHQGYVGWVITDWLGLGGEFLFLCLALLVVMGLARVLRRSWWLPATAAFVALAAAQTWAGTYLIPDTSAARGPHLVADGARLARAEHVEGVRIDVERVRKLTTEPNAEATGLGATRRVILWDTLVDGRFPRAEVRAVLAHELGHLSRDHLLKDLGWLGLFALPTTFAAAMLTRGRGGLAEPAAVPLALLVVVVVQLALTPAQAAVSRRYEGEADWVALQTTRDPAAMRGLFRRFTTTALSDPSPPSWWQVLFASHPSDAQRVGMADAWEARAAATPPARPAARGSR